MNGLTTRDINLVDFPYPDDWYDDPEMLITMRNPTFWQLNRDHKHDLAFRQLETSLLEGKLMHSIPSLGHCSNCPRRQVKSLRSRINRNTRTGDCRLPTFPLPIPAQM